MTYSNINGLHLYEYIISGATKMIQNEKYLNAINVFPVADGDTGSNLAYTMNNIIRYSDKNTSVSETMTSIATVALSSSYGNSGTIVAGYFNGLSTAVQGKHQLTHEEFVNALSDAVHSAYDAIASPKEGTILTVMREWSTYLNTHYKEHSSFEHLLQGSLVHAKNVLAKTKDMLKELREANIIDAGAKGFVYFIEGIFEYVKNGQVISSELTADENQALEEMQHIHQEITARYCTEFILEKVTVPRNKIIKALEAVSDDSLIVSPFKDMVKVHLHIDNPEEAALVLRKFGTIVKTKVDDMKIQYAIANERKHTIGLITDSIADLPESFIEEHQITVIPLQMLIDGATYIDRVTLTSDNTYKMIDAAHQYPSSSQPNETDIEKILTYLRNHFDYVVGIFISSKMSGTIEKVKAVVNRMADDHIAVIDSKMNSGSEGLIVREAALDIEKGLSFSEIVEKAEERVKRVGIFVRIPDLNYATKSGRVPKVVGKVASIFKLKVVISIDAEGEGTVTKERHIYSAIKKLTSSQKIENYVIVHSSNPQGAQEAQEYFTREIGKPPLYINNVSAIIAAFIGKGAVGICFLKEQPKS
jgi:uncharacterized protein